jgi:hypothetical protein
VTNLGTKAGGYQDLIVWQKGIVLVKRIYQLTKGFPRTTGEFIQFVSHAEGSIAELDTQLIIAVELSYCEQAEVSDAFALIAELRKMLNGLRRKLEQL